MADIFDDLDALRLDEADLLRTSIKPAAIQARKPARDEWFRVSPLAQHAPISFPIYQPKISGSMKNYLLTKAVASNPAMRQVSTPRLIYVAINRAHEAFLSMVGIGDDGYSVTSREGHQLARQEWVRLVSDRVAGNYTITTSGFADEPVFPQTSYNDLLRAAFGDAGVISTLDHPVAQEIMGIPSRPHP